MNDSDFVKNTICSLDYFPMGDWLSDSEEDADVLIYKHNLMLNSNRFIN